MRKYFNIAYYEILLRVKEMKQYRMQVFSEVMMFVLIYMACIISDWGSTLIYELGVTKEESIKLVFIGYVIWQIGCIALGYSSNFIKNEAIEGILEVKQQSVFSYEVLLFLRMSISVVTSIVTFIVIAFVFMFFWGWSIVEYILCLKALSVGILTVLGMFGMGLVFGAAVLHEKNIGKSVLIVQAVLLFFSNVFSVTKFKWILLFPYTWAIDIGRNLYLGVPISIQTIIFYIVSNLCWLVMGLRIFAKAQKNERLYGMFNNY